MGDPLSTALEEHGGADAPPAATAQLRVLLASALRDGASELVKARSGYGRPVTVAIVTAAGRLSAMLPVSAALRSDPHAVSERAWLLAAAVTGALVEAGDGGPARFGEQDGFLVISVPGADADLACLAFEDHAGGVDRLRATALAVPATMLAAGDLRDPIGATHPLRIAEAVARLGGRPADSKSLDEHEEAVLASLPQDAARPHEDADPARRVARRILQRLHGMGKWGGYHTDFIHLPRGFAGNERALASTVGEALIDAGLLAEKPSVGQRHVFLNSRRAGDIHRLIDEGIVPDGLRLPD